jgi:hypothetical protein
MQHLEDIHRVAVVPNALPAYPTVVADLHPRKVANDLQQERCCGTARLQRASFHGPPPKLADLR